MPPSPNIEDTIRRLAAGQGFAAVRFAAASPVPRFERFTEWLARSWQGSMDYMTWNPQVRADPSLLVEGARSVICLAVGYAGPNSADGPVARFARGRDYHRLLRKRCHRLMDQIRQVEPAFAGRAFVDAGPIAERSLAAACGLGWIGGNGCVFVEALGSYVVLCEIVCNLALTPDPPIPSRCTQCNQCVRACPTGALGPGGMVDARRCRSYLSVEHRGPIDPELWPGMEGALFGCDLCQQACPHNRAVAAGDAELMAADRFPPTPVLEEVLAWSAADWDVFTQGRTLRRQTYLGYLRNAILWAGSERATEPARRAFLRKRLLQLQSKADIAGPLAGELAWALEQLGANQPTLQERTKGV